MRILVLENEPSSRRGGQEFSLLEVCRGLARRGHKIDLLYTADGDLLVEYRQFCRRIDRVTAYAINRSQTLRSIGRLAADLVRMGRQAPDVIYANQYLDSLFARLLSWRFQRPFVCHLRLPPPDVFCGQYRWGMAGIARLIATSNQTREDYVARGFDRDHNDVVHNGISTVDWQPTLTRSEARSRLRLDQEAFLVAYAGRFHPSKGIEVLIEALPLLSPDAQLVIAGREIPDGRKELYEEQLKARAAALGVTARCQWIGHIRKTLELYRAADVTVLPSIHSETFGRTMIESMACCTPVVASNSGGIPEILTGEFSQHLFPISDSRALAERLNALHDWMERDPGLGGRCREHVKSHFDIGTAVAGVEQSLERTVAEWRAGVRPRAAGATPRAQNPCASA